MKHIILNITSSFYLLLSLLHADDLTNNQLLINEFSFDNRNNSYHILGSDSLFHIIGNLSNDKFSNKKSIILSIDSNLNQHNKEIIDDKNGLVLSGKKLQNNHYLFVGYNKNNNDEWNEISVIKTDPKFNVIWSKNYGANNYDCKGYEVIEKNDDEYWILGYTKASKNNVLLLKINGNGEEKWFSYLPDIKCTFASHMLKNKSNEIIIAGQNSNTLFVSKINDLGQIIWNYEFSNNENYNHRLYDIKNTDDGGYIIVGNTTTNTKNKKDILMIKISKNGKEEWYKIFGNKHSEVVYDIEQTIKSNYIICGFQLIENNQYCSFIIKTDSLGNSLDEKYFNKINSNKIYDVEINNNIILGIGNTELVDTTKIFVVKINNMID